MKRIISIFLVLVLASTMVPTALAAEPQGCGNHATWTLKDGVLTISGTGAVKFIYPNNPWWHNPDITELVIEEGITTLEDMCLSYIPNLQKITFPDSLQWIGSQVFQGCNKLEQITLPKNLKQIKCAASSFTGNNLKAIYVHPDNTRYYSIDGVLMDRAESAVSCYPMGKTDREFTIPQGIRKIEYGAFWRAKAEQIYLPQGLTTIGQCAFAGANITSVQIPDTVTAVESSAFENCDRLQQVTLPQSVQTVRTYAFASCMNLETLTILNPQCQITNQGNVLERNALLRGYWNSSLHVYAQRYGRNFQDVETGTVYSYDYGNAAYMELLPQQTNSTYPSFANIRMENTVTGEISGYQPSIMAEWDTTNATYQEMLAFVNELTADCVSDYEKARVICQWVNRNMTYVFGMIGGDDAEDVYRIWRNRCGNCECYTQLANFMLYLAGIPNATIYSYDHTWSAAWLEGRWVMVDSTNDIFDASPDTFDPIEQICFAANDNLVCVIDDLLDVKLASYGPFVFEHDGIEEITIPSYVTFIYKTALITFTSKAQLHDLTIRGTAGSYAEEYIRQNIPSHSDITYQNDMFVAKGHIWQTATCTAPKTCTICGETSGNANGHSWKDATCTSIKTCTLCGTTEGSANGHSWKNATCTTAKTCTDCGVTEGSALGHSWKAATCDNPKICTRCKVSSGRPAGHTYDDNVDGTCNGCGIHRETTENRTVMHMFRMYDPNSGEHFYTGSTVERENLVAAGWHYEGVGFTFSLATGAPVYRLYDRHNTFEHLYTMDVEERDRLVAEGWELEGIAFNSAYDTEVPQYRLHNPNETRGAYHFTASEEERDNLIAAGWEYQGIGFYSSWK